MISFLIYLQLYIHTIIKLNKTNLQLLITFTWIFVDSNINTLYIPINQISTIIHSLNIKSKMWNRVC